MRATEAHTDGAKRKREGRKNNLIKNMKIVTATKKKFNLSCDGRRRKVSVLSKFPAGIVIRFKSWGSVEIDVTNQEKSAKPFFHQFSSLNFHQKFALKS